MSKIIEIIKTFNVQLALKNIYTKIDEIIKKLNDVENNTSIITGSLTAAQINALDTTPITLLGVAGANKYYVVENASFHYKPLTVAFTGSFTLRVRYTLDTARDIISNALDDSSLNTLDTAIRISNSSNNTYTNSIINQSIEIYSTDSISGGNGTINYSIKYRTVTTS